MIDPDSRTTLYFADFTLQTHPAGLRQNGVDVPLQSQPLRLLTLLVCHQGKLVSHEEIRKHLWGDVYVDFASGVHVCIRHIRKALQDVGDHPKFIETIPRKGYRFVAPVRQQQSDEEIPAARSTLRHSARRRAGVVTILAAAILIAVTALLLQVDQAEKPGAITKQTVPSGDDAYLLGRQLLEADNPANLEIAREHFAQAIAYDANFAPAYAGMALAHELAGDFGNARIFAERSIATDGTYAEGYVRMAAVEGFGDWHWQEAEENLRQALALVPERASVHSALATVLMISGRYEDARREFQIALNLEPESADLREAYAFFLYSMYDFANAQEQCQAMLALIADPYRARVCSYKIALAMRDDVLAVQRALDIMLSLQAPAVAVDESARLPPRQGIAAFERWRIENYRSGSRQAPVSALDFAFSHAVLREFDESFFYLVKAHENREPQVPIGFLDPVYIPLRHQTRFIELAAEIGVNYPPD